MRAIGAWLSRNGMVILIAAIGLLLPALAVLQYRWTGELTQLEQLRARNNMSASAQQFSTQFDAMLAGIYTEFNDRWALDGGAEEHAPLPALPGGVRYEDLARQVLLVERRDDGTLAVSESDPSSRAGMRPAVAPPWLDARTLQRTLIDEVGAMVVRPAAAPPSRWVLVELDLDRLLRDVLPALLAGCMEGGIPLDYDVLITRDEDTTRVVYESRPGMSVGDFESWVTMAPLFAVHARDLTPAMARGLMPDAAAHRWRFFIKGREGALEAAVGAARLRNLGVGAGVLTLLALSVGLLVATAQRAQRGAREQLELVARMSHELRTPLTSILGFSEILLDQEELTDTQRRFCQKVQDSGFQLQASLNQLVDLSRLEAGQTEVFLQEFSLRETLRESCAAAARMAQKREVKIEYELAPEITTIVSDQGKFRQIVFNFIAWAVGRSPIGDAVKITATLNQPAHLQLEITDNGEPVPEMERLFDPESSGADDPNINHLGIIIARRMLELLEGSVSIKNCEPQGIVVTIQLPAKPLKGY